MQLKEIKFEMGVPMPDALEGLQLYGQNIFVLLLGPSGVGKSSIICEMNRISNEGYKYIKPYTTRSLRDGEKEKIHVPLEVYQEMVLKGDFVIDNALYGNRYGTPMTAIIEAQAIGKIPILDFPLTKVDLLKRPEYRLLNFYICPPTIAEWLRRMGLDSRAKARDRIEAGYEEMKQLAENSFVHPNIHMGVINHDAYRCALIIDTLIKTTKYNHARKI
jgi:guanylate kinase